MRDRRLFGWVQLIGCVGGVGLGLWWSWSSGLTVGPIVFLLYFAAFLPFLLSLLAGWSYSRATLTVNADIVEVRGPTWRGSFRREDVREAYCWHAWWAYGDDIVLLVTDDMRYLIIGQGWWNGLYDDRGVSALEWCHATWGLSDARRGARVSVTLWWLSATIHCRARRRLRSG
jgi:hypothetical protein